MARFYLPAKDWQSSVWELTGDEAHHAARVMRLKKGDKCVVFDGEGRAANAEVAESPHGNSVLLIPGDMCEEKQELAHITLCQSVPKGSNMDFIIQKAVELGVSAIVPLITERTIVRLNVKEASAKQKKWQRTALEACKQCGQNTLPIVHTPIYYNEWIQGQLPMGLRVIASLVPGVRPVRDVLEEARVQNIRKVSLLVGPEGDFTDAETQRALDADFVPVSLGPIVLRVETASMFGIAAMRYALD
ncbi:MAG: 16S rRNA (uracil(1498)-N(3))-methyltransferase [Akkermansia sp.]|nr:16S rRNA (uracil(1498)-N(3))-methyltransferase [Akkermansia sp.]